MSVPLASVFANVPVFYLAVPKSENFVVNRLLLLISFSSSYSNFLIRILQGFMSK